MSSASAALVENLLAATGFPCHNLQLTLAAANASYSSQNDAASPNNNSNSNGVDAVLDCLFSLITQIQKEQTHRDELQDRLKMAHVDVETYSNTITKLKSSLESAERQISLLLNKNRTLESSLKEQNEKAIAANDKLVKETVNFNATSSQFKHKLKRQEADFLALQEKLQKIASRTSSSGESDSRNNSRKATAALASIKFVNGPLVKHAGGGGVGKKSGKSPENEMFDIITKSYEDREKQLLVENQMLRRSLHTAYSGARDCLGLCCGLSGDVEHNRKIEDARFQLPFSMVQAELDAHFKFFFDNMAATAPQSQANHSNIGDNVSPPQSAGGVTSAEKVTDSVGQADTDVLKAELEEYKEMVRKQAALLEQVVSAEQQQPEGVYNGNLNKQEELEFIVAELEMRQDELDKRSKQLDEERHSFTHSAVRLGKERAALQREREMFEQERQEFETMKVLQNMPQTPLWLKDSAKTPLNRRHHSHTPSHPHQQSPTVARLATANAANAANATATTGPSTDSAVSSPSQQQQQQQQRILRFEEHDVLAETHTFAGTSAAGFSVSPSSVMVVDDDMSIAGTGTVRMWEQSPSPLSRASRTPIGATPRLMSASKRSNTMGVGAVSSPSPHMLVKSALKKAAAAAAAVTGGSGGLKPPSPNAVTFSGGKENVKNY